MPACDRIFCSRSSFGGWARLRVRRGFLFFRRGLGVFALAMHRRCGLTPVRLREPRSSHLQLRPLSASNPATSPRYRMRLAAAHIADRIEHRLINAVRGFLAHFRGALLALCRGCFGLCRSFFDLRCALRRGRGRLSRRFCVFALAALLLAAGFLLAASRLFAFWARASAAGAADFAFFLTVMGKA